MKKLIKKSIVILLLSVAMVLAAASGSYIGIAWQGKAPQLNAEIIALFN